MRSSPQGSILGPLSFLLYINNVPQAVDCDLLVYADTYLLFQHKNLERIKEQLTGISPVYVTGL